MKATCPHCPSGHQVHYEHDGSFKGRWFRAVCRTCGWGSPRVESEQALDEYFSASALGRKGGQADTEAQKEARSANFAKAREKRWPKKPGKKEKS